MSPLLYLKWLDLPGEKKSLQYNCFNLGFDNLFYTVSFDKYPVAGDYAFLQAFLSPEFLDPGVLQTQVLLGIPPELGFSA